MPYTDFYLRFGSKEQAEQVLFSEELQPLFQNMDVIGVIHKPSGNTINIDGLDVNEMVTISGYHVNVRALEQEDTSELPKFAVHVNSPVRTWA